MADPGHPDLLSGQAELLGKPHRLAGPWVNSLAVLVSAAVAIPLMIAIEIDTFVQLRSPLNKLFVTLP
jgi:hypothetical protein